MPFVEQGYGALENNKSAAGTPPSKLAESPQPVVTQASALAPMPSINNYGNKKPPFKNVLHKYPSYTYIWSLFCLPSNALADPPNTYLKSTSLYPCILRSAGQPNNRVKTVYGKFDFFIDDVEIESLYGHNAKTGNSNATDITFNVIEPYSMGMFMQAMSIAAEKMKYSNYGTAHYCLKLEFKGVDQNGMMINVPKTTKFFPITIKDVSMNVTEAGAVYRVTALPYVENSLLDDINKISSEIQFSGATVGEALQYGPKSLQAVMNDRLRQTAVKLKIPVADEIVILFPTESGGSAGKKTDAKEQIKPAAAPPGVQLVNPDGTILSKLGVSRDTNNLALVQSEMNLIGQSSLGYDPTRRPLTVTPATDAVYDIVTKTVDQSKVTSNSTVSNIVATQNATITKAIERLILSSNYVINTLKAETDKEGKRWWFRIQPEMYEVDTEQTNNYTGRKPRIYVYKVIPYRVHSTALPKVGQRTMKSKYDAFQKAAVKVYNYIYTGSNTDIIKLNLEFDNMFQSVMAADNFSNGMDAQTAKQNKTAAAKSANIVNKPGDATRKSGQVASPSIRSNATRFSSDNSVGAGEETPEVRASKLFNEGLLRGQDMVNLEMEIVGDPYWLTTSGLGNWSAKKAATNLLEDETADWLNGEVDMIVSFRSPVDIDPATGLMKMASKNSTKPYRGLYKVNEVSSRFKDGQFTQLIKGHRRPIEISDTTEVTFDVVETETKVDIDTGESAQ